MLEPKIAELGERRVAIEDRLSRTDIRAPIAGTVNELAVNTIGGVITPAETLVTIVPKDAPLNIEAQLAPTDIDQVISVSRPSCASLPSTSARRRSFPARSPMWRRRRPSTRPPASPTTWPRSTYRPTRCQARQQAALPGMPVEVFMSTEPRTALSYFSKPFTDQFSRAFREQ